MIKATFTFTESEQGLVDVTIEAPPADEQETRAEAIMLLTFMALNNLLAEAENHKALSVLLGPEIQRILKGEDQ